MHDPSVADSQPTEEYLTPDEVAARFKVSKRTIMRWLERGELPSIKIGGTVRIPAGKLRETLGTLSGEDAS